MRPHPHDPDGPLVGHAVLLDRGRVNGVGEPMLDVNPPRVEPGQAAHKPLVGRRRPKRVGPDNLNEPLGLAVQPRGLEVLGVLRRLLGEDDPPHGLPLQGGLVDAVLDGRVPALDERLGHAGDPHEVEGLLDGGPLVLPDEYRALALGVGDGYGRAVLVGLRDDVVDVLAKGGRADRGHGVSQRTFLRTYIMTYARTYVNHTN